MLLTNLDDYRLIIFFLKNFQKTIDISIFI